jgi:hypothetical protein
MSDILEIIKSYQLRKIQRSEIITEAKEQCVESKVKNTKAIIGGYSPDISAESPVLAIKGLYYNMLESYTGRCTYFIPDITKHSIALWTNVEKARAKVGCDAEHYLKAQFYFFDKAFGKAPTVYQLATSSAIERAIEFTGSTKGRVLGNMRPAPISKADVFRESEKLLQNMMASQGCTREEFYEKFVLTGIYTFPKDFLRRDPTYKKLINR